MHTRAIFRSRAVGVLLAASLSTVTIAGVTVASVAAASATMTATTSVNLRSGPGTSYGVLMVVPQGGRVQATGASSGSWLAVTYNGTSGYMNGTYLAAAPDATPTADAAGAGSAATTVDVNVRTGPGTTYSIVAVATQGTTVTTTGVTSGNWTQVTWSGATRWISSTYLTRSTSSTEAPSTPTPPAVTGQVRTTTALNLRTAGYLGAPVWGVLPGDSVVDLTGESTATYVQIQYQGEQLWISNKYVVAVTSGPTTPTAPAASGVTAQVVAYALAHVGYPYDVGTKGPDTYDCAGLVTAAYASAGVTIPYSMVQQSQLGTSVDYADLRPGDVIVWGSPVSAVSIYVGNDQLVIADGYGYGIRQMSVTYRMSWATFGGGRRYVG